VTKIIYGEDSAKQCVTIKEMLYETKNPSEAFGSLDTAMLDEAYRAV
jgi:hypothetical protein